MSDTELTAVKFLKQWRAYNKGDIAGFEEAVAKKLVDGEVAEFHKAGKSSARTQQPAAASGKAASKDAAKTQTTAVVDAAPQSGTDAAAQAGEDNYRP